MADDEIHQLHEPRNEKYECEDGKSQGGVRHYFAANVSIEQAHKERGLILALRCGEHGKSKALVSCESTHLKTKSIAGVGRAEPEGQEKRDREGARA
jgi:hypothetical protein